MKCRKVVKDLDNDKYNIVYFGSIGLQNPYAILFKIDRRRDIITDLQDNENILTNADGSTLYINEHDYITLEKVDILNKELTYSITILDGLSEEVILSAYYFTEEMYNPSTQYSSIVRKYPLDINGGTISFDVLQMAKRWDGNKNYAEKQDGIASSLIQRLSLIQGDLWEDPNYGLPLFSKVKDKFIYDSIIINIILKHPDVREIISFKSNVNVKSTNHGQYSFECTILSAYNDAITIASNTLI